MIDVAANRARFSAAAPFVDERVDRLVAVSEARAAGRGGIAATSAATGVARSTIGRGLAELGTGRSVLGGSCSPPWSGTQARNGETARPAGCAAGAGGFGNAALVYDALILSRALS
jgi:hypothetical protein